MDNVEKFATVRITKRDFVALSALSNWLDGFAASGKGRVVGSFELTMFLRSMKEIICLNNVTSQCIGQQKLY